MANSLQIFYLVVDELLKLKLHLDIFNHKLLKNCKNRNVKFLIFFLFLVYNVCQKI